MRSTSLSELRPQPEDLAACRGILRHGSKSFAAASLLLPARVRGPAAAVYAYCRVADDAVDSGGNLEAALHHLHQRLDVIYAGRPSEDSVERAFAWVVRQYRIPRDIPLALLEGFAWDAAGRVYETVEELEAYCVRVASTVGLMMSRLMGVARPEILARAADLGIAMQLTNIARDVGEDARAGRLYLPRGWLREAGVDMEELLRRPCPSPALARVVQRLLERAGRYYARADLGIGMLPRDCRVAIRAARLIYADIGRDIAAHHYNSVTRRAFTSKNRKLGLLLRAFSAYLWRQKACDEPPPPAAAHLICGTPEWTV
jgi:phytoene synthase